MFLKCKCYDPKHKKNTEHNRNKNAEPVINTSPTFFSVTLSEFFSALGIFFSFELFFSLQRWLLTEAVKNRTTGIPKEEEEKN